MLDLARRFFAKRSYNSVAYFGRQGAGKTLQMVHDAIRMAVARKRGIVGNLDLNPEGFYNFGVKYKIDWLKRIADEGQIINLPSDSDLDLLFRYPYSIILFDEAGAKMFSRNFQKNNKNMVEQGVQLRKNYCTLLWTAQYENMADKFLRATVERCVWCDGVTIFNADTQKDILLSRSARYFWAREFWVWCDDPKLKMHPVQTMLKSLKHEGGRVTQKHKDIFNCFNSHAILGSKIENPLKPIILNYRYRCDLPRNYYLLRSGNMDCDDPMTRMRYRMVEKEIPTDKYINYLAYSEDPFFAEPPKPERKRLAVACHLPGYFETEKPLPVFKGWDAMEEEKVTPISSRKSKDKKTIDPRVLAALKY